MVVGVPQAYRMVLVTSDNHLQLNKVSGIQFDSAQTASPGARFSKVPKTFRAHEAIFNYLRLKNKAEKL